MCARSIQLGGGHLYYLFHLPYQNKTFTPHQIVQLSIQIIVINTKELYILIYLDVLCIYELGQLSYQAIALYDIILRQISNKNIYLDGLRIIFTMGHTQIKPSNEHPARIGYPSLLDLILILKDWGSQLTQLSVQQTDTSHQY